MGVDFDFGHIQCSPVGILPLVDSVIREGNDGTGIECASKQGFYAGYQRTQTTPVQVASMSI